MGNTRVDEGHENGVDCSGEAGSGLIVATGAGRFHYPKPWKVTRRFYRVVGTDFVPQPGMTEHATAHDRLRDNGDDLSKRFPEISDSQPFPSCTEAAP